MNTQGTVVRGRGAMSPGCEFDVPGPLAFTVFGASGDLTRRKIMPALYRLHAQGHMPPGFFVMGAARSTLSDDAFRQKMRPHVAESVADDFDPGAWDRFSRLLYYTSVGYDEPGTYATLGDRLGRLQQEYKTGPDRIYYLAIPPQVYEPVIGNLGQSGLAEERGGGFTRLVIEKPFGHDLASAIHLNETTRRSFREHQVYRMDHYLAKETVQNVLMFRFANSIFEPLWNNRYIDHVQITVSEKLGVEERAGYYEEAGVIRDMFQNHIFQLLSLMAMEPPSAFRADRVRDEKVKVFGSVRPFDPANLDAQAVVGQYAHGEIDGAGVRGYRSEPGVAADSVTATYAAMAVYIDNWRWRGVPFYLRSGKRMRLRKAEIAVKFKGVPHQMFAPSMSAEIEPNTLVLRVQPDEGINLHFQTKNPGSRMCLNPVTMDFSYEKVQMLDAYERILLDCMMGDQMLFVRADGVNQTWEILSPVIERLEGLSRRRGVETYPAGGDGPEGAVRLLAAGGHAWRPLGPR